MYYNYLHFEWIPRLLVNNNTDESDFFISYLLSTMKKVQGNDSFQRINYLYQISKYMAGNNPVLSAYYGNLMVNVAKKNVLKIHPDIKRQICKKCRSILIDNKSGQMSIKNKNKLKHIEWICNTCGAKRNFPAEKHKDHRVWVERPEAVEEVMN